MNTEDLQHRLEIAIQAVEEMNRIVQNMEKLVQILIQERDAAIAYIQASNEIDRAKL